MAVLILFVFVEFWLRYFIIWSALWIVAQLTGWQGEPLPLVLASFLLSTAYAVYKNQ